MSVKGGLACRYPVIEADVVAVRMVEPVELVPNSHDQLCHSCDFVWRRVESAHNRPLGYDKGVPRRHWVGITNCEHQCVVGDPLFTRNALKHRRHCHALTQPGFPLAFDHPLWRRCRGATVP